jgi:hypothetical protein
MYSLLIRLMALAAFAQLGISVSKLNDCKSRECLVMFEKAGRKAVKIEWKPISVFPEEAKRFQQRGESPQRSQR